MRLNDFASRQYVIINKMDNEHPCLVFFDSKEEWDEANDGSSGLILFEGYVDIADVEITEHPDFEWFIKEGE